ncbi:MAG: ThiF family adenylyltransferase [Anaeromyxobacteraceae bacterium]
MALNDLQVARYARQLLVPGFGEAVQERLLQARVWVVNADATAAAGLVALVQAGVGRIWLDDDEQVGPSDRVGWLFGPGDVGRSRVEAAVEALGRLSLQTAIEKKPVGGVPTAAIVFASSVPMGIGAGDVARKAGIPHVVVEPDAEGGAVVSIPPGQPCFTCGRSVSGVGRPAQAGIAALSALAATELLLMLADPPQAVGRRIDLVRGVPHVRPTVRVAGCACGGGASAPPA